MAVLTPQEFIEQAQKQPEVAAVLGSPIKHSLSPVLYTSYITETAFETVGQARDAVDSGHFYKVDVSTRQDLEYLLKNSPASVRGFAVTMPNKFFAVELADYISSEVEKVGSANTLAQIQPGVWKAYNTDINGIRFSIDTIAPDTRIDSAVIVGNGGTARPALYALAQLGVEKVTVLARKDKTKELLPVIAGTTTQLDWLALDDPKVKNVVENSGILISTVPPEVAEHYLDILTLSPRIVDVIYNPVRTRLYSAAESGVNGLVMLAGQAVKQYSLFDEASGVERQHATSPTDTLVSTISMYMDSRQD